MLKNLYYALFSLAAHCILHPANNDLQSTEYIGVTILSFFQFRTFNIYSVRLIVHYCFLITDFRALSFASYNVLLINQA